MNTGDLITDFLTNNLGKITDIAKKTFKKVDAKVQTELKTAYKEYLTNTRLKYSKSKSFFIRDNPVELYSYYVPTGVACDTKVIKKPLFQECVDFTNRIVLTGTGGSGKSILIKHLFLDCIQSNEYTPVLIELRDLNSEEDTLDNAINKTLSTFGFNISADYVKNAKDLGHFCFFFDGFDEIKPTLRNKTVKQILSLSKQYTKCPIFISSRPDDVLNGIEDFFTFRMLPLELDEAIDLVQKLPFDTAIKEKFSTDLKDGLFVKHKSFLSNPLLLSIMLLTYGENAEIPTKLSIFYNQAFEALFQRHDAYKGAYLRTRQTTLDIQDFSKAFSLFCLLTYDKRLFKMSRIDCLDFIQKSITNLGLSVAPEAFLHDLLSAACLLVEDGLEIAFSHRSFQEYFVAVEISKSHPDIQAKLIERYWLNMYSDNVIILLMEIDQNLVERTLLLPKLEEIFNKIGVKRSVGVTHLLRLIKLLFSTISIEESLRLTYVSSKDNKEMCLTRVLDIITLKYSNFEVLPKDEIQKHNEYLVAKYQIKGKKQQFKTEVLTINSPIFIDLNKRGLWFSVYHLTEAFSAYKKLKNKHNNPVQNLEDLLGIK